MRAALPRDCAGGERESGESGTCPVPFWLTIPARPTQVSCALIGREPAEGLSWRLGWLGSLFLPVWDMAHQRPDSPRQRVLVAINGVAIGGALALLRA